MSSSQLASQVAEILSTSYSPSGDEGIVESPEIQLANELHLESVFSQHKAINGLNNRDAVQLLLKLLDVWIGGYKLAKCDAALTELRSVLDGNRILKLEFELRFTQALAFTRWKQGRFLESIVLFRKIESMLPTPSAALFENMAHTYSTLGEYSLAQEYFKKCIELDAENKGGVLLGLGLLADRTGDTQAGLVYCSNALDWYTERFSAKGNVSSLEGKAALSVSKMCLKLTEYAKALQYAEQSCHVFRSTCGMESPLLANALKLKGEILLMMGGRSSEARESLMHAFSIEAHKDAIDLVVLIEIEKCLVETFTRRDSSEPTEDSKNTAVQLRRASNLALVACRRASEIVTPDANLGALFKIMAELAIRAEDFKAAEGLLDDAIRMFSTDTSPNCSILGSQCLELLRLLRDRHR